MNEHDTHDTASEPVSPLDRAAAAGDLHWTHDPVADPEGTDDGVPREAPGFADFDARG